MKTRNHIAVALLLSGAFFIGCDKKKDATPPGTPAGPADTTKTMMPTSQDVKSTTQQLTNDVKSGYDKTKEAGQNGLNKIEQKMPTTLPSFGK